MRLAANGSASRARVFHDVGGEQELQAASISMDVLACMMEGCQVIGFDWRYLYVNDELLRQSRRQRDDLVGRTMMECYPGLEDTPMFAQLRRCMLDRVSCTTESELRFPDGTQASFELRMIPTPQGVCILSSDVTERRDQLTAMARELARAKDAAERTNKELESFSYSISHDLRAPLRSIDGFSLALAEDYSDQFDERAQQYLGWIRQGAQRMSELIDDLLALSRLSSAEMQQVEVDLAELAGEILAELRRREPDRRVEVRIEPRLFTVGDPSLLRIALENALTNAWKFTMRTQNALIEVGVDSHAKGNAFFVRDNGAGLDGSRVHKLFAPFQRLHSESEFPGTGIGLATVQRIVRRHGGHVWIEGEAGRGATLWLRLSTEPRAPHEGTAQ